MDKNKIIEAAAKLVAKGAYDKAIKEYQKVLEADPKDVRILQKMGELYQKKNDNVQAAVYFTKVAESYANDGFFLKAVALYKQVLKLDPSLMDVNIKLAELHQQLQLMGEAMAYYQIVANHYDKSGDVRRSLDVLKKMVDLDPDNVPSRVKLADLYVREGMNGEAIGEFQRAAEHLKRQNRTDDYVRVAERISVLDPSNLVLAKELAELYLQRNDQKRALAKLQICFKADSRDIDTLRLLAVAFQGLGQTSKTISVYKELARAYEERGQQNDAEQVWAQVGQLDPNDPDVAARSSGMSTQLATPAARMPMPGEATSVLPAHTPRTGKTGQQPARGATGAQTAHLPAHPAQPAQPQHAAPGSTVVQSAVKPKGDSGIASAPAPVGASNLGKLLTETDVYVKYGLHDKALEHLRKIFSTDPENIDAHEKAYAIYMASNNHAQAFEQLLNVLRLHTRRGDAQRAQPFLAAILQQNPGHPEVPAFLATLRMAGGGQAHAGDAEQNNELPEDAILVDSSDDEVIVADEPADVISGVHAVDEGEVVPEDEAMMLEPADAEEAGAVSMEPPPVDDYPPPPTGFEEDPRTNLMSRHEEPVYEPEEEALEPEPISEEHEPDTGEHALGDEPEPRTDSFAVKVRTVQGRGTPPKAIPHKTQPQFGDPGMPASLTPTDMPDDAAVGLGDEPYEAPTRVGRVDPSLMKTATGVRSPMLQRLHIDTQVPPLEEEPAPEPALEEPLEEAVEAPPDDALTGDEHVYDPPPAEDAPAYAAEGSSYEEPTPEPAVEPPAEEAVEPPPADEPASEECDEATFFIEQGLNEEAREILETVLIAYPDHQRAARLMAQLEGGAAAGDVTAGDGTALSDSPPGGTDEAVGDSGRNAFDLAQELANEVGDTGEAAAPAAASDEYQVSVEEVFSEFKKGLEKVVKPEDVDTHYDLGIAYKEMGLMDDAIGEFTVARKGCLGKRKEVDCLTMMGLLQIMKGDPAAAIDSFLQALASEHSTGDLEKATRYELAAAYEASGQMGRALSHFMRVQALDGVYRDVAQAVERLSAIAVPEDDPTGGPPAPPPRKPPGGGSGGAPTSRKVGYV